MPNRTCSVNFFANAICGLVSEFVAWRKQVDPGDMRQTEEDWWDDFVDFVEAREQEEIPP